MSSAVAATRVHVRDIDHTEYTIHTHIHDAVTMYTHSTHTIPTHGTKYTPRQMYILSIHGSDATDLLPAPPSQRQYRCPCVLPNVWGQRMVDNFGGLHDSSQMKVRRNYSPNAHWPLQIRHSKSYYDSIGSPTEFNTDKMSEGLC